MTTEPDSSQMKTDRLVPSPSCDRNDRAKGRIGTHDEVVEGLGVFPGMADVTRTVDFDSPWILRTRVEGGVIVMPKEWRDDDDD